MDSTVQPKLKYGLKLVGRTTSGLPIPGNQDQQHFLHPQPEKDVGWREIPAPNTLQGLTPELKSMILHFLSDSKSLLSLTLACRSFHHIYLSHRNSVLSAVAINSIHSNAISDAWAVHEASRIVKPGLPDEDPVPEFLGTFYFAEGLQVRAVAALTDPETSISLLQFHRWCVGPLLDDLTATLLSAHPISGLSDPKFSPLSLSEMRRISRALYRFQLYCILFKDQWVPGGLLPVERPSKLEWSEVFLDYLSPWEVEEMCCVHDYLYKQLWPMWEKMAYNDAELGEYAPAPYCVRTDLNNEHMAYLLSRGLPFLQTIILHARINGYDSYSQLIRDDLSIDWHPFTYAAGYYYPHHASNGIAEEYSTLTFQGDNNAEAPNIGWLWAHNYKMEYDPNSHLYSHLRAWGYALWDKVRLERWGILWEDPRSDIVRRNWEVLRQGNELEQGGA
ncbi:hypothetical protein FGG08_003108 [Glutinoglossum americanum]|uniref:F-box domain-containing protein n=1 Tax=Glutinoglossum americanum TaxID=1670608 RepID=A0A9P8I515_9PEZI|nr:hypothetical protein FGG08_003108 [Glutinoglossum americanum]